MKYCRNCGKQLEDNVKFCTQCGTPCARKNAHEDTASSNNGDIKNLFPVLSKDIAAVEKSRFNTKPKLIAGVIIVVVVLLIVVTFINPFKSKTIVGDWNLYAVQEDEGWLTLNSDHGSVIENSDCTISFKRNGDVTITAYDEEDYGTWEEITTSDSSIDKIYSVEVYDDEVTVYFRDNDYSHLYYDQEGNLAVFTKKEK